MIYDFKCSICYGLVRPPTVMCGSCDKIFCEVCIRDVKTRFHKGILEESLGVGNVSVMDMLTKNLLIVTLGNFIGGGIVLAGGMSFQFGALGA